MLTLELKKRALATIDSLGFPRTHVALVAGLAATLGIISLFPSEDASALKPEVQKVQELKLELFEEDVLPEAFAAEQLVRAETHNTQIAMPIQSIAIEEAELVQDLIEAEKEGTPEPLPELTLKNVTVKAGDNLSKILARAGLTDRDMFELIQSNKKAKALARLYPGHRFEMELDANGKLTRLSHHENLLVSQTFQRTENGFDHSRNEKQPEIKLATRAGIIKSSLYMAAKVANIEDRLIMELASIFGWDVDFALDIRENDSFKLLYEEKYLDGKLIGTGNVLAAEFINRKKTYTAVRYEDSKGNAQYFAPNGDTMRKEFLRTPIEFARISSHFNLRRKHPVLNKIRAHKGTDYAAPSGTPIKCTGDGKVIFAGVKGGYGKTIIVQHGGIYRTLYAHLKSYRKGIRVGRRVKQGQTIGYVGATGLATGPHLHYEFHVNGAVRNPVTVKLPKARAIAASEKASFNAQIKPLLTQLNPSAFPAEQVATNESDRESTQL